MARTWTQVKAEKHALGCTDSARVVQLKADMLEEVEAARSAKVLEAHGEPDGWPVKPTGDTSVSGGS